MSKRYPICDDQNDVIAVLELTDKTEKSTEDLNPLLESISKHFLKEDEKETPLRREIALALYDKNPNLSPHLKRDLEEISNHPYTNLNLLEEIKHRISEQREKTFMLICTLENMNDVETIGNFVLDTNVTAIFVGPDSDDMILKSGKYNIASYIPISKYDKESLQQKIKEHFYNIAKNPNNQTDISIFVGTTGGSGTTTIASNLANVTATANPLKNILFLDLSTTKAISNIFFGIPAPKHTIVDLLEQSDQSVEEMQTKGLYKIKNNLFTIAGIQSHIDIEQLYNPDNIRALINLLYMMKRHFDYIIIDGGLAQDSELQIAIEEICDHIHIVTELTTIHMSVLQTYYELMRKAGWRDKVKIVINRENSQSSISLKDAKEILALEKNRDLTFDILLPNEASVLRECWNYGKMVTDTAPNADFSKALKKSPFYSDISLETPVQSGGFLKKLIGKKG